MAQRYAEPYQAPEPQYDSPPTEDLRYSLIFSQGVQQNVANMLVRHYALREQEALGVGDTGAAGRYKAAQAAYADAKANPDPTRWEKYIADGMSVINAEVSSKMADRQTARFVRNFTRNVLARPEVQSRMASVQQGARPLERIKGGPLRAAGGLDTDEQRLQIERERTAALRAHPQPTAQQSRAIQRMEPNIGPGERGMRFTDPDVTRSSMLDVAAASASGVPGAAIGPMIGTVVPHEQMAATARHVINPAAHLYTLAGRAMGGEFRSPYEVPVPEGQTPGGAFTAASNEMALRIPEALGAMGHLNIPGAMESLYEGVLPFTSYAEQRIAPRESFTSQMGGVLGTEMASAAGAFGMAGKAVGLGLKGAGAVASRIPGVSAAAGRAGKAVSGAVDKLNQRFVGKDAFQRGSQVGPISHLGQPGRLAREGEALVRHAPELGHAAQAGLPFHGLESAAIGQEQGFGAGMKNLFDPGLQPPWKSQVWDQPDTPWWLKYGPGFFDVYDPQGGAAQWLMFPYALRKIPQGVAGAARRRTGRPEKPGSARLELRASERTRQRTTLQEPAQVAADEAAAAPPPRRINPETGEPVKDYPGPPKISEEGLATYGLGEKGFVESRPTEPARAVLESPQETLAALDIFQAQPRRAAAQPETGGIAAGERVFAPKQSPEASAIKEFFDTGIAPAEMRGRLDHPTVRQYLIEQGRAEGADVHARRLGELAEMYERFLNNESNLVLEEIQKGNMPHPGTLRPEAIEMLYRAEMGEAADPVTRAAIQFGLFRDMYDWQQAKVGQQVEFAGQKRAPTTTAEAAAAEAAAVEGKYVWETDRAWVKEADKSVRKGRPNRIAQARALDPNNPEHLPKWEALRDAVAATIAQQGKQWAEGTRTRHQKFHDELDSIVQKLRGEGEPTDGGEGGPPTTEGPKSGGRRPYEKPAVTKSAPLALRYREEEGTVETSPESSVSARAMREAQGEREALPFAEAERQRQLAKKGQDTPEARAPDTPEQRSARAREVRFASHPEYSTREEFLETLYRWEGEGNVRGLNELYSELLSIGRDISPGYEGPLPRTRTPEGTEIIRFPTPTSPDVTVAPESATGEAAFLKARELKTTELFDTRVVDPYETHATQLHREKALPSVDRRVRKGQRKPKSVDEAERILGREEYKRQRYILRRILPAAVADANRITMADLPNILSFMALEFLAGPTRGPLTESAQRLSDHLTATYNNALRKYAARDPQPGRTLVPMSAAEIIQTRGQPGAQRGPFAGFQPGFEKARTGMTFEEVVAELIERRSDVERALLSHEWGAPDAPRAKPRVSLEYKGRKRAGKGKRSDAQIMRPERLVMTLPGSRIILVEGKPIDVPPDIFTSKTGTDITDIYDPTRNAIVLGKKTGKPQYVELPDIKHVEQNRANLTHKGEQLNTEQVLWILQEAFRDTARTGEAGLKRQSQGLSDEQATKLLTYFATMPDASLAALSAYLRPPQQRGGGVWDKWTGPIWGNTRLMDFRDSTNVQQLINRVMQMRSRGREDWLRVIDKGPDIPTGTREAKTPPKRGQLGRHDRPMGTQGGLLAMEPVNNPGSTTPRPKGLEPVPEARGVSFVTGELRRIIERLQDAYGKVPGREGVYLETSKSGFEAMQDVIEILNRQHEADFPVLSQRAMPVLSNLADIISMRGHGQSAMEIASRLELTEPYVESVVNNFPRNPEVLQRLSMDLLRAIEISTRYRERNRQGWDELAEELGFKSELAPEALRHEAPAGGAREAPATGEGEATIGTGVERGGVTEGEGYELGMAEAVVEGGRGISVQQATRVLETALRGAAARPELFEWDADGLVADPRIARLANLIKNEGTNWTPEVAREANSYAETLRDFVGRNIPNLPTTSLKAEYATEGTPLAANVLTTRPKLTAERKAELEAQMGEGTTQQRPPTAGFGLLAHRLAGLAVKRADAIKANKKGILQIDASVAEGKLTPSQSKAERAKLLSDTRRMAKERSVALSAATALRNALERFYARRAMEERRIARGGPQATYNYDPKTGKLVPDSRAAKMEETRAKKYQQDIESIDKSVKTALQQALDAKLLKSEDIPERLRWIMAYEIAPTPALRRKITEAEPAREEIEVTLGRETQAPAKEPPADGWPLSPDTVEIGLTRHPDTGTYMEPYIALVKLKGAKSYEAHDATKLAAAIKSGKMDAAEIEFLRISATYAQGGAEAAFYETLSDWGPARRKFIRDKTASLTQEAYKE